MKVLLIITLTATMMRMHISVAVNCGWRTIYFQQIDRVIRFGVPRRAPAMGCKAESFRRGCHAPCYASAL